jgi:hypothetical protein
LRYEVSTLRSARPRRSRMHMRSLQAPARLASRPFNSCASAVPAVRPLSARLPARCQSCHDTPVGQLHTVAVVIRPPAL